MSTNTPINDAPRLNTPEAYQHLRAVLREAGYTDETIYKLLKIDTLDTLASKERNGLLSLTDTGSPLDTLIRLFLIEVPCEPDLVRQAISPMQLEDWQQAGLIKIDSEGVWACIKLIPFQNLILAHDLPLKLQSQQNTDFVMGIGQSSLTLSNLTLRNHVQATLDLGTGCGIQAFLAAPHSDHVSAVDYNPRAVRFAEFNARLNGLDHVACKTGHLFEPVAGETFDLIISNPPFVISPENRYIYRDGGLPSDQICRTIINQAPHFLNEGGFCHILCNWIERKGLDWQEPLREWFTESGCDVWVMRSETKDTATYASNWIHHTEKAHPEKFDQQLKLWLTYYQQQAIDSIGSGIITMRRSSGKKNWFRADEAPDTMRGPCGYAIEQGFALRDYLESAVNDDILLDTTFHYSPDLNLERHSIPSETGWQDETVVLKLARGLTYSGQIDTYIADLIINCNGQHPLRELMLKMAKDMALGTEAIAGPLCKIVRGLVERGFILPPSS